MTEPAKLFYVYAKVPRDEELRDELETHLALLKRSGAIESFYEGCLSAGSRGEELLDRIDEADAILLLVSPNLMAGADTNLAFRRAIERHELGEVRLIPIILRPTDWQGAESPFGNLVALPSAGKPVTAWGDRDTAWVDVVKGLRTVLRDTPVRKPAKRENKGKTPMSKSFENGHALLVGVGGDLPATETDAQALYDLLTDPSRAAYPKDQVELITGAAADRKGVLAALDRLVARVEQNPDATVLVYYSGHGWRVDSPGADPRYYLLANGYRHADLDGTAVSGDEFSQRIRRIETRKLLVLLDCCHAAGIPKSGLPVGKAAPIPPELLGHLNLGRGQAILASSEEDQSSFILPGSKHSLFTQCLLEAMAGAGAGGAPISRVLQVILYVVDTVFERSDRKQKPLLAKAANLDNFPLCFVGGGQGKGSGAAAGPTAGPAASKSGSSSVKEMMRKMRQGQLDTKLKAMELLLADRAVAINPLEVMKLDHDIAKTQADIDQVEHILATLG